jgi:hypothetical protein
VAYSLSHSHLYRYKSVDEILRTYNPTLGNTGLKAPPEPDLRPKLTKGLQRLTTADFSAYTLLTY